MEDRILEITDLLMGAAHADRDVHSDETRVVRDLLADLLGGGALPAEVEARVTGFQAASFELASAAKRFVDDPPEEKRKLLQLIAAVRDADEVIDLDEDTYLHDLARAVGVPEAEVAELVLDYEVADLRSLRTPPPVPRR